MKIKIKLNGCNLSCAYCPDKNRGVGENNISKIIAFIKASKQVGLNELQWSGGEPTIQPLFLDLVKYGSEIGFYQSLSTNGTCEMEYLHKLKEAGISRVNISLDTLSPSVFKSITKSNRHSLVMKNIKESADIFDEITKINTVVSDINHGEVYDIYRHFRDNKKIITRFLQLTYKGDDSFTDGHRLKIKKVEDVLPVENSIEIRVPYPEYTNPVARYFKNDDGIFSIIPQDHGCRNITCNKLWYINGEIFTCKMKNASMFHVDKNIIDNMIDLMSSGCIKKQNKNGHKVANAG